MLDAVSTVIREQAAVIETVKEFIRRPGLKPALHLAMGLPGDREPTPMTSARCLRPLARFPFSR